MNKPVSFGKNSTEVIKVKEKINQLFKDKLFLVMLVLGLLTIVAAAGVVTIQRGTVPDEENPYMQLQDSGALIAEEESGSQERIQTEGPANATKIEPVLPAGDTEKVKAVPETKAVIEQETEEEAEAVGTGAVEVVPLVLNFTDADKMIWPVMGNVLLDYSMDSTIYFPTLAQYQVNPGLVIQAEVSQPVAAPANARVMALGTNEELGNYVQLDLGNDYVVTCGQLKEIQAVEDEYLEVGQILGYVAEPTKYYSIEGSNVYFQLSHEGIPVDPLDYLE